MEIPINHDKHALHLRQEKLLITVKIRKLWSPKIQQYKCYFEIF